MDTDFDAWHDHMRSVWQRQADVRKQKRSILERSADEREEMSTKERVLRLFSTLGHFGVHEACCCEERATLNALFVLCLRMDRRH